MQVNQEVDALTTLGISPLEYLVMPRVVALLIMMPLLTVYADVIGMLSPAQMMKIASGNTLLCRFRFDDELVWGLLTNHGKTAANDGTSRLHASIVLAGRHQEAA